LLKNPLHFGQIATRLRTAATKLAARLGGKDENSRGCDANSQANPEKQKRGCKLKLLILTEKEHKKGRSFLAERILILAPTRGGKRRGWTEEIQFSRNPRKSAREDRFTYRQEQEKKSSPQVRIHASPHQEMGERRAARAPEATSRFEAEGGGRAWRRPRAKGRGSGWVGRGGKGKMEGGRFARAADARGIPDIFHTRGKLAWFFSQFCNPFSFSGGKHFVIHVFFYFDIHVAPNPRAYQIVSTRFFFPSESTIANAVIFFSQKSI